MQIRNLGGSGLRVSAVGLGCNNFGQRVDLEGSRKVIHMLAAGFAAARRHFRDLWITRVVTAT